jgi:hypothetical protein
MSEQFTISTVPLPNPCGRPSRYPYRQLAVGGSTFTMRRVTENGEWGIRVFRTQ